MICVTFSEIAQYLAMNTFPGFNYSSISCVVVHISVALQSPICGRILFRHQDSVEQYQILWSCKPATGWRKSDAESGDFLSVGVTRLSGSETCDSHSHFCQSQRTLNTHLLAECTPKGRLFHKPAPWVADGVLRSGWETTV